MCGIFGFIGSKPDFELLTKMIVDSEKRGPHSWGVWSNETLLKGEGKITNSIESVLNLLKESKLFIGHCRLATSGKVNIDNQMPFIGNNKILVHNGNIYNHEEIRKKKGIAAP